jgi:subtilase family serine protease
MRDEHVAFFNQLNKKINEINELMKNYNIQANKLHDVILIIRELRIEQRERNVEAINSNTLLFITEDEVIISIVTFKKLFDSSIFIDDKDLIIDD